MESEKNGNTVLLTVIGVATLLVALVGATFAYFSATISNQSNQSVVLTTAAPVGLIYLGEDAIELTNLVPGETSGNSSSTATFTVENPSTSTVKQTYDLTLKLDANTFTTKHIKDCVGKEPTTGAEAGVTTKYCQSSTGVVDCTSNTCDTNAGQLLVRITQDAKTTEETNSGAKVNVTTLNINSTNFTSVTGADGTSYTSSLDLTDGAATLAVTGGYNIVDNQLITIGETQRYKIEVIFVNNASLNQDENQARSFQAHIDISDAKSVQTP